MMLSWTTGQERDSTPTNHCYWRYDVRYTFGVHIPNTKPKLGTENENEVPTSWVVNIRKDKMSERQILQASRIYYCKYNKSHSYRTTGICRLETFTRCFNRTYYRAIYVQYMCRYAPVLSDNCMSYYQMILTKRILNLAYMGFSDIKEHVWPSSPE